MQHYIVVNSAGIHQYQIEEPVGFDEMKVSIKRGTNHGMSAQYSEGTLGFYRVAANVIREAYNEDLDTDIKYIVRNYAGQTIYEGAIDLGTYEELTGKKRIVQCSVGEIGAKTTFNNRTSVDVDLNGDKTIDGATIAHIPDWHNVVIPQKNLLYTNLLEQKLDLVITKSTGHDGWHRPGGNLQDDDIVFGWLWKYDDESGETEDLDFNKFIFPLKTESANEFGSITQIENQSRIVPYVEQLGTFYSPDENHSTLFGENTEADCTFVLKATIDDYIADYDIREIAFSVCITDGTTTYEGEKQVFSIEESVVTPFDLNLKARCTLPADKLLRFYMKIETKDKLPYRSVIIKQVTIHNGTYFKMEMYDNKEEHPVSTDVLFVHDALNIIAEAASENALTVKSDFYSWQEAAVNSRQSVGYGAMKAITNGYHIRGILLDEHDEKRNMPMSFKNIITSLNAMDCIGWGFSEEGGSTCIRVERWDWFYQSSIIMRINDVAEVTRKIDTDAIPTSIKIGYKKYTSKDEYSSIDSVHGERVLTNGIKAVSKEIDALCDFIADNYAIELTRRESYELEIVEEGKYDENIFVFELTDTITPAHIHQYKIRSTAEQVSNINRPSRFINAKLSPRCCADRWRNFLFATNNQTPFKFTSGTINYTGAFKPMPYYNERLLPAFYGLEDYGGGIRKSEDASIEYTAAIFKAETLTFEHPVSIDEYHAILSNPYGLVVLNGEQCWIKEFSYKFADGMGSFVLVPRRSIINPL